MVSDLLLNGFAVNTGLFHAVPQFRGVVRNGQWDPEKNSIYVSFTQDKELREAIAETSVNILGDKSSGMYISGVEDAATHAVDGSMTPGRNFIVTGRLLKVAGGEESVGITLVPEGEGEPVVIEPDMLAVNNPSQLVFLIPAELPSGVYTLTITTQYNTSTRLLKEPRSVSRQVYVG